MELDLQPVTTDRLNGASANRQDGARLTYFDVRVSLNTLAPTNRKHGPVGMPYKTHEREKKRAYEQLVLGVEHRRSPP